MGGKGESLPGSKKKTTPDEVAKTSITVYYQEEKQTVTKTKNHNYRPIPCPESFPAVIPGDSGLPAVSDWPE